MKEDGTFEELKLKGIIYSGKRLLDYIEDAVKMAYFLPEDDPTKDWYRDFMWYLWCGPKSPVYGKDNMATFENYFVADKAAAKENMNPYYKKRNSVIRFSRSSDFRWKVPTLSMDMYR